MKVDALIRRALNITPQEVREDLARRETRIIAQIGADMADVVPCSEDAFREALAARYELDPDRDDDARMLSRLMGRLVRYPDEQHEAPYLVTFPALPRLDIAEVQRAETF